MITLRRALGSEFPRVLEAVLGMAPEYVSKEDLERYLINAFRSIPGSTYQKCS